MNISSFDDLLQAARQQSEAQRLLFVFASAELPADATPAQRERFFAGQGGALVPIMFVDKTPDELNCFADLVEESRQFGQAWQVVFAAAMSGTGGLAPSSEAAEAALQRMVEAIKAGNLGALIPFDRHGEAVHLG
ncbi:MAG: ribonucleotide reductase subunit alpha [Gammaproteobacteria bacterium]|uniref:ribonucleotide reductase subunit alpha n=1 Tax=Rhodoferax sp. TaxID=50421 RepID=UPI001846078D|nr:ribonucleotide reductase subunit alpha [Rhodoferax sp.]MBU3899610.1 ribonucleotide reductase subunit alpha [Gammaproteobacteria bacterium]MBA3056590.1 ribonucleotide reductase subunit alpha [Rhodoferax sp.]MBU3998941.1 ribonucleotide reductase subunit alpha [Gammaproteobacteria bacterium]MBU4018086.1 ribonucleotide reductase subunit alpha [Gammaproteobacteria bacterium]MBU4080223.1 ribonucleotide reductase subunit alpha [Gammaproteobacteria bacterium]